MTLMTTLRVQGLSYKTISRKVGLSRKTVGRLLDPERERIRKIKHRETVLHTNLNGVNGNYRVNKSPYSGKCEMCGNSENVYGKALILKWHHWNDKCPEHGVWVCGFCHDFVEILENRGIEFVNKYFEFKKERSSEIKQKN
jgi:transcription elongation factor Elf1